MDPSKKLHHLLLGNLIITFLCSIVMILHQRQCRIMEMPQHWPRTNRTTSSEIKTEEFNQLSEKTSNPWNLTQMISSAIFLRWKTMIRNIFTWKISHCVNRWARRSKAHRTKKCMEVVQHSMRASWSSSQFRLTVKVTLEGMHQAFMSVTLDNKHTTTLQPAIWWIMWNLLTIMR